MLSLLAFAPGASATRGPAVTVRIEARTRTLLASKLVHTHSGWIRKGGTPQGGCSSARAAGALDVATHHHWTGTWYSSVPGLFINSIFGVKPRGSLFWELFVNGRTSNVGVCAVKLHRGDQLLFAIDTGAEFPIVLQVPRHAQAGTAFSVKAVYYNAKGKLRPLAGAAITGVGVNTTTSARGTATVTPTAGGTLVLHAAKRGFIRAAPVTVHVA